MIFSKLIPKFKNIEDGCFAIYKYDDNDNNVDGNGHFRFKYKNVSNFILDKNKINITKAFWW